MLEIKDYRSSYMVFPFLLGYAVSWIGFEYNDTLIKRHVQYTELITRMMSDNYSNVWYRKDLDDLQHSVSFFKKAVWALFGTNCDYGTNILKFHLLDHLVNELERFETIHALDASPYDHYNFMVKQVYLSTSNQLQTTTHETVRN